MQPSIPETWKKETSSLMVATPSSRTPFVVTVNSLTEGFNFIGTGVSGGEEGAPERPIYHARWPEEAYELVAPILTKIAAVAEDGEPLL